MKKLLNIAAIILLTLAGLVIALMLFTQSQAFKSWLRDAIVEAANQKLNGKLTIGRIDGNLVTHFSLFNLLLAQQDDTLLAIKKVHVAFSPKALLQRRLLLRVVAIDSPRVYLRQRPDSTWNLGSIVRLDSGEAMSASASQSPLMGWNIQLDNMRVSGAAIAIHPLSPLPGVPAFLCGLDMNLTLGFTGGLLQTRLDSLSFAAHNPDFRISSLRTSVRWRQANLAFEDVVLQFQKSRLEGQIDLKMTSPPVWAFELRADPISLDDLAPFVPDWPIHGQLQLSLSSRAQRDTIHFDMGLQEGEQHATAKGWVGYSPQTTGYYLNLGFENFDMSRWYGLADTLPAHRLTGTVQITGKGVTAKTLDANFEMQLSQSRFLDYSLANVHVRGNYRKGQAAFHASFWDRSGMFRLAGKIDDVLEEQRFQIFGEARRLNLATVLHNDSLRSGLNLDFEAKGKGLTPETFAGSFALRLLPSHLFDVRIDTAFCAGSGRNGDITLDTLQVVSPSGTVYLAGRLSLDAENDVRFRGVVGDLRWMAHRLQADTLYARGALAGRFRGRVEDVHGDLTFGLSDIAYNQFYVDTLGGSAWIEISRDGIAGAVQALAARLQVNDFPADSLLIDADFRNRTAGGLLRLSLDSTTTGSLRFRLVQDSLSILDLDDLQLRHKTMQWALAAPPARIQYGDSLLEIDNLQLQNKSQRVSVLGALRADGKPNLHIKGENIKLAEMIALFNPELTRIDGRLRFNALLSGTLQEPVVDGFFQIQNGRFTKYAYDSLNAELNYANRRTSWLFQFYKNAHVSLRGDGYLPLNLGVKRSSPEAVTPSGAREPLIDPDGPFRFQVATQGIDLSFLQSFIPGSRDVQGTFVCDVRIESTLNEPIPVGNISIFDGAFRYPKFGLNYKDVQMRLHVTRDRIRVTEFDIGTDVKVIKKLRRKPSDKQQRELMRGRLWIEPDSYVMFDTTNIQRGVTSMNLRVRAYEFMLANSSDYKAQIDADIRIVGHVNAPRFDGRLTVLRSSLYLPALEKSGLYDEERIRSLLARIIEDSVQTAAPVVVEESGSEYYRNLRGTLKIEIPKNTWIRSPDMNVEIAGTLDLVKSGAEFEQPFGTIQVIRGTYSLLDAYKFEIEEGTLYFEGGHEFNPRMDVKARYFIRNPDRTTSEVRLHMTGKMFAPELSFTLDNEEIETTEAVMVLVTGGRRTGSGAGRGLLAGNGSKEATGVLTGFLTSQLSRLLMKERVVDVLEVKGDLTGDQASIIVGKYLTNKLFVSLEKAITLGNSGEGLSDEVTIEYALSRYIILQAIAGDEKTTGFDIFLKFSK